MKYWEKALCGMYYVGGKSNAPCYITNIDGLLFATNENKETARLIVTPDLRVVVEAWHISGEPDQIPDILWNNGTWWSRSAFNGFFIKTNVVSPGWERLSVQ